ncbi:hypothetical protein J4479_03910 [Candidatus Woesearchaeota archaeon]|nr:hypothetical protein [Candidatus Woesearchaeota archaeon]
MYKIPLDEVKEKIITAGSINSNELDQKIHAKINELSGLVSEEGAAHIIANELGINLTSSSQERMKIRELYSGMRSVSTAGKVLKKFEVREFNKNGRAGKVCSIIIGDETETVRVVFWNDQVESLSGIKEQDLIVLKDAYVKDNNGGKELHLGDRGSMEINPAGLVIAAVREPLAQKDYARKEIGKLQTDEQNVELMGTVVQVFDPRFFLVHPETGRKLRDGENIQPALSYVMNLVLDDGTGNIRCVFWKNQANHLLAKSEEEMAQFKDGAVGFDDVKTELLGEQLKLRGRVKKNDMFERLEFNVQFVEKADPKEELARIEK